MTVSTNPTRADYDGNGTATTFPYAFPVSSPTDIKVWQLVTTNPLDAVQTLLTLDVDYSVTMLTASSGYVTRLSGALPADYHWTIILDLTYEQPTSIKNQGQFYEDVHEAAFDRNVLLTKQVSELIGRTITLPVTLTDVTTEIDNLIDGAAFGLVSKPGGGWQVTMVANSGAQQTADLANTTLATKGAGLVGYSSALGYGAATVGGALNSIPATTVAQAATFYVTAGTAPAYTLTPSPALAAYTTGTRYRVRFHEGTVTGTAVATLNVSGLGAKNLKTPMAHNGSVSNPNFPANAVYDVEYDGTQFVLVDYGRNFGLTESIDIRASADGTSASISITATRVIVRESTTGGAHSLTNASLTLNTAGSGANGLDTGTIAASTWYYMYVIYNANAATAAALCSLSATTPTMPTGYGYARRIGAFRTDGTANKFPLSCIWRGGDARYKVAAGSNLTALPQLATGTTGSISVPTWTAVSVSNFVPPTAIFMDVSMRGAVDAKTSMIAPNNAYGAYNSTTNPPPCSWSDLDGGACVANARLLLESTNVYAASDDTGFILSCRGWEDAI